MLVQNTRSTLLHASKIIILHQWTILGNYILELFWIVNINKNMSFYILQDMQRVPCTNINTKSQHPPSMHHTNGKYQIMGPKISGQPMRAKNLSSHSKKKYIKIGKQFIYCARTVDLTMMLALGALSAAQPKGT